MPLITELKRDGVRLTIPWSEWHLNCVLDAAYKERGDYGVLRVGTHLFEGGYIYGVEDESLIFVDGEKGKQHTFEIKAGDEFNCWRSF